MMSFKSLLPNPEVREALQSVASIEQSLPNGVFGPSFGFDVIKGKLRKGITGAPDELQKVMLATGYPIRSLVIILARNYVYDELRSGSHMVFSMPSMTGQGLISLHGHLTDLLEQAGTETEEEARGHRAHVHNMLRELFG